MNLRIRIKGLKEAPIAIREAIHAGVLRSLNVAGARGQQLVVQNITSPFLGRPPAVAFGILANSIAFDMVERTDISRVEIKALPPADVYADPVETGTMPHFPPPSALVPWVKKKFNVSNEKQALSIAFAIARKIKARGTSAFGMFARAFNTLQAELKGIFESGIATELQKRGLGK